MNSLGDLRVLTVEGRVLLAGLVCSAEGFGTVQVWDAASGDLLDTDVTGHKEWWFDPAGRFTSFRAGDGVYVAHSGGRWVGYCVQRVTPAGLELVGSVACDDHPDDGDRSPTPAVVAGRLTLATHAERTVRFRDWRGGEVVHTWTAPDGWVCDGLVSAGTRCYAWLGPRVPAETPVAERWRYVAERGSRLWEIPADIPAGPPLKVRGYEWGPWPLAGRPVMLFKVNWRTHQVWDVGRREPLGPALGDLELSRPCVGLLHGRPALAAVTGTEVRIWDLATGRVAGTIETPEAPIAVAIGGDTVWAVTDARRVLRLTIDGRRIHPSASRRLIR